MGAVTIRNSNIDLAYVNAAHRQINIRAQENVTISANIRECHTTICKVRAYIYISDSKLLVQRLLK